MVLSAMRYVLLLALIKIATAAVVSFTPPTLGSGAAIDGTVTGLPNNKNAYRVGILVSGASNIWWDKTHDYPDGVPIAVNVGIPLDGVVGALTFHITGWV